MTNYSYKDWVQVEDWHNQIYLLDYVQYHPDCLVELFKELIQKAEAKGLVGCYLRFQSHTEPRDGYLDSPSVTAVGYRKHTVDEKEEIKEQMRVEALAKELGVSIYEAKIVQDLKKRGKL